MRRSNKYYIGCTTSLISVVLAWYVTWVCSTKTFEFFTAIGTQKHLVNFDKNSVQRLLVVPGLEGRIIFDFLDKMISTKLGDFRATVTIKDSEERMIGYKVYSGDMSVFIGLTPALHA